MAASLFTKLKKYAGAEISQDENYATELLASLLYELPVDKLIPGWPVV